MRFGKCGAVKSEFNKFGDYLKKLQKNLHTASDAVDELLGKRTKTANGLKKYRRASEFTRTLNLLTDELIKSFSFNRCMIMKLQAFQISVLPVDFNCTITFWD